jgi:hypothetical protein
MEHMNELSTLLLRFFPFSLKDTAKTWFNSLSPGSLNSPIALVNAFF